MLANLEEDEPELKKPKQKKASREVSVSSVNVLGKGNPNKGHTCSLCGKAGHLEADCFTKVTCSKCNEKGHPEWMCDRIHLRNERKTTSSNSSSSNGPNLKKKVNLKKNFMSKYPKKTD
jgi:hypothetical protein